MPIILAQNIFKVTGITSSSYLKPMLLPEVMLTLCYTKAPFCIHGQ